MMMRGGALLALSEFNEDLFRLLFYRVAPGQTYWVHFLVMVSNLQVRVALSISYDPYQLALGKL